MAGTSNRIGRTNDDIQRVLSGLLRQVKDPRVQQGMISVTRVETTGDLRYAKVWLSVLGQVDERELKRGLKSCGPWLRRELGSSLSLRYTPELVFELDHSIEYGAHISRLIEELDTGCGKGKAPEQAAKAADDPELFSAVIGITAFRFKNHSAIPENRFFPNEKHFVFRKWPVPVKTGTTKLFGEPLNSTGDYC